MATQTVEFPMTTAVATPYAAIYSKGSDTLQESVTPTEATNRKGVWTAAFTDAPADDYQLICGTGSSPLAVYDVNLTLTTATFYAADRLNSTLVADTADAVWDEAVGGHNVAGSFGRFIRQIKEGTVVEEYQCSDPSATTTSFITNAGSAVDDFYNDTCMMWISGDLTGQVRTIQDYDGTTKTFILDEALTSAPANGDEFLLLAHHIHAITQIQAGRGTLAKQDEILADIATLDSFVGTVTASTTPVMPDSQTLNVIRGDAYDGTSNDSLTWTVTNDVTGKTINFTVRNADDGIVFDQDTAGVTISEAGTTITVSLASSATELLPLGYGSWDLEVVMDTDSYWTAARGTILTVKDQTRR